jgi:UDP-N-acetylmuramate--alanine ligase
VIYSPAVRPGSPGWVEVEAARASGIPTLRTEELIQELTQNAETVVAISGTHGKSTTTAMIAQILEAADRDPTVYIGAPVLAWGGRGYRAGDTNLWVVEADEYERKLLSLSPTVAVITNIEFEHPDIYKDLADVEDAFVSFIQKIRSNGTLVVCGENDSVRNVVLRANRSDITTIWYGAGKDQYLPDILPTLSVPGYHNRLNALAALAVSDSLGINRTIAIQMLASFRGAGRRLEQVGERNGVVVIDDYGHNPTEVAVSIKAVHEKYPNHRLVVAFQPHQHARLQALFIDFANAFDLADLILITDVFAVPGRDETVHVDPKTLVKAIVSNGKDCRFIGTLEQLAQSLDKTLQSGDIFLTIGATSITDVGRHWVQSKA